MPRSLSLLMLPLLFVAAALAADGPSAPRPVPAAGLHAADGRLPAPTTCRPQRSGRRAWSTAEAKSGRAPVFSDQDLAAKTLTPPAVRPAVEGPAPAWQPLERPLAADARPAASREAPWSADRLLADATGANDAYVSLAVNPVNGDLYAVFEGTDLGATDRDIHIARSSDDGQTWTVWELPSYAQDESMPDIAIDGAGFLHVVWVRADGYIVRTRSSNAGDPTSWAWIRGLFTDSVNATPTVAVSGAGDFSTVFIAASYQEINWDLFSWEWTLIWSWSTDGGATIQFDALVPDGYPDLWPDAAMQGALVHLVNGEASVWGEPTEILLASDAASGGFGDVTNLSDWTPFGTGFPRVACEGAMVYTVFQHDWDDGVGNIDGDIVFHFSDDAGQTVYGPYDMVSDEYESVGPALAVRDGVVSCQWIEAAPGDDQFWVAARQAGGGGYPEFWPDVVEVVTDMEHVEPQYHFLDAAVGDRIHSAWIDRRDSATQGHNVYTADRMLGPDLLPYAPAGWEAALVAADTPGVRTGGWLRADAPAYVSFGLANLGMADVEGRFDLALWIDGALAVSWNLSGGLPTSTYAVVEDHAVTLAAGLHDLELRLDPSDAVTEEDETNNTLLRQLLWISGDPALRLGADHVAHFEDAPLADRAAALAAAPPVTFRRHLPAVAPSLAQAVTAAAADVRLPVILEPARRLDADALAPRLDGAAKDLRRAATLAAARAVLADARAELDPVLAAAAPDLKPADVRELWLGGQLAVALTPAEIAALADRPEVGRLWLDDRPSRTFAVPAPTAAPTDGVLEWHLARIGAPDAWALGLDGTGVLVGHLDSGAAYDHPDLAGSLWDGGAAWPHHGWDAVDGDNDPYEGDPDYGHGTHTAGLVVGDGSAGRACGPAPGAELMILRAVPGYYADLVEAMQFGLDHGPVDLFTMSAGWDAAADELRAANRDNAAVLLTAGIPWICAAGNGDNYGGHHPIPTDIASPGDCPNPWYGDGGHTAVITIGATGSTDAVWSLSSRGPTAWGIADGYADYPYPPGLIKPDLAAPGDGVTSASPGGGYVTYSGTSMATPVAAGAVAILLQSSPGAAPAELARALEASAVDLGTAGRDTDSGAGRLLVPAALDSLSTTPRASVRLYNDGPLPLHLQAPAWQAGWLNAAVTRASVAPGDSAMLVLEFETAGLAPGLHHAVVTLASDDPAGPHAVSVTLAIGDVTAVDAAPLAPASLAASPNPFNPRTELSFHLAAVGRVNLELLDLRGRRVRTLLDARLEAGPHTAAWDGRDDAGRALPGGLYLARLTTPAGAVTSKLTLVR